jgi:TRAP-type C4-dicarboxylate transport system permease small subunit
MHKSYFAIMRLPLMGMLLTGLCFTMYLEKVTEEAKKITRIIWPVAALICSLKTGLTSLEILLEQEQTISNFRLAVFALVLVGVAVLGFGAYKLVKNKLPIFDKDEISRKKMYVIAGILAVYAIIVFLPRFLG